MSLSCPPLYHHCTFWLRLLVFPFSSSIYQCALSSSTWILFPFWYLCSFRLFAASCANPPASTFLRRCGSAWFPKRRASCWFYLIEHRRAGRNRAKTCRILTCRIGCAQPACPSPSCPGSLCSCPLASSRLGRIWGWLLLVVAVINNPSP